MAEKISTTEESASPAPARRPALVRFAPIIVVALLVVLAFAVLSRPSPGRRTNTATSAGMIISTSDAVETVEYPITLQEGGDAAHEASHVFEPFQGTQGIANVELDWSSDLVLKIAYDPAEISEQQIASIAMSTGYVAAPGAP